MQRGAAQCVQRPAFALCRSSHLGCHLLVLAAAAQQYDVIHDDLRPVVLDAYRILPATGFQMPADVERLALLHVLGAELAELSPGDEIVELRLALLLALGVFPLAVGRKTEFTDCLPLAGVFELGRVRDIPEKSNGIHRFHREMGKKNRTDTR